MSAMVSDELRRVLIVDDDAGLRTLLRMTLESAALEVDEAPDARVAEDRIAVLSPDVIVLDIHMPGIDGQKFRAEQLADPALARIPVIVYSVDREARLPDAVAHVEKGFDVDALLDLIPAVCAQRALEGGSNRLPL